MSDRNLSLSYRFLKCLGMNYSEEEYGQVSLLKVLSKFFGNIWRKFIHNMMDWAILEPVAPRLLRPKILKWMGCHVGKDIFVGDHVRIDSGHADLIYIDDYTHITGGCRLLCHQRDLSDYRVGDNAATLPYRFGEIRIGKGVMIGMETLIMPGVTIGDGAIIGAHSLVTRDIPAWCIATGQPAKIVKTIIQRDKEKEPKL